MWYEMRLSPKADPHLASSAQQLLQSTSRALMLAMGGTSLFSLLALGATWPADYAAVILPPVLALVPACALALWLVPRRLLLAQAAWQVGYAAAVAIAMHTLQQPLIGFCYALLPLMAVVTVGWPAGLLAEAVTVAIVYLFWRGWAFAPLPGQYALAIAFGGLCTWLIGWAATRVLLTVTQWSVVSYEQARRKVEQVRDQQVELKQIRDDLLLANRELARLSARLQAMNQVAEQARRAKEEFVANVSHELRTPLNMIIGFSELIAQTPRIYGNRLPAALLADIAAIHRNSQQLARLVDDVLDLSQVEAGRMALSREWIYLPDIIDSAIQIVAALFDSKGLSLVKEVAPDLPPAFGDGTRIRQVLINLLSNAGRFTEQGGVRIRAWCEERALMVSVTDTGPGIAVKDRERLFEPFQQADGSIRRRHGGSGLGLSISRRLVEMHGGKMDLASEEGVGTTITFSLPLEIPLAPPDDPLRWLSPYQEYDVRSRRSRAPAPALPPRYVLLEQGEVLGRLFRRYVGGVEVVSVEDAAGALAELGRSPAQALIVNAGATRGDMAAMGRLADLPYGTPLVTCWVPGQGEAARRLGVVRYLVKPIAQEVLLAAIADVAPDAETVLLVDDEPEVLQLFARMLGSAGRGYRVLRARNGRRALELLRQRRPDAILLDLSMPQMDGYRLLSEKSQDPALRELPVIVISASDPTGNPVAGDTLSVTRHGGLPVRELLECIQAVSGILAPSASPADRARPGKPAS